MIIKEITDKKKLDDFVSSQPQAQFLQSWDWGLFNSEFGQKIWHLGMENDGRLVGALSFFKKSLPFGWSYFYSPRGPILNCDLSKKEINGQTVNFELYNFLFKEIKQIAKRERAIFWRLEPAKMLADKNLIQTIDIQPRQTLIVDLSKSEAEILSLMHQKTRYNIRLAEKKGVVIKHGRATAEQIDLWWNLLSTTGTRDNFKLHPKFYYEKMFNLPFVELWRAEYQGEILAMAIIVKYGDMATYVHGASSNSSRQLMAPHLLHWEAMKSAKSAGLKYYDFYGVDERRWPGVSRFKFGFGGQIVKYYGTFDFVFNRLYYGIYQLTRKLRRLK